MQGAILTRRQFPHSITCRSKDRKDFM